MLMFLLGIFFVILGCAFIFMRIHKEIGGTIFIGIMCSMFGALIVRESLESMHPSAIDVYRGKTELKITYQNGVPIDSTVVFKENK